LAGYAGGQRLQNLVFPVTLLLDRTTIAAEGAEIPVMNGMAVPLWRRGARSG
jgi:hypothetical protein